MKCLGISIYPEKSIVLDELHCNRGDVSDNLIRSSQSRVKYKVHISDVFNATCDHSLRRRHY